MFPRKPPPAFTYISPKETFDLIHQDEDIIIISKPSGLLSVPGRKASDSDCLQSRVIHQFPSARIVHRLDMDTSGLMVMAMNAQAHRQLSAQFERRETSKTYIARVWGHVEDNSGHIDLPLICDWPNRPMQKIDLTRGKSAQTNWCVLEREGRGVTRVSLTPITGRTHQLRVHMAEIGHPILGDDFYAHEKGYKAASRLQLHAYKLTINHPQSGEKMHFESPCPF